MRKFFLLLGFLIVVFFCIGVSFFEYSKSFRGIDPRGVDAEAVVVITGGEGRLSQALALFSRINAQYLIISGVSGASTVESIFSPEELVGIDQSKVLLEKEATSTHENALFVRDYLIRYDIQSVVLVTSTYHMKRALFIFQTILPANIELIPYAIQSDNFKLEAWWKSPKNLNLAFQEFLKYWWYWVFL